MKSWYNNGTPQHFDNAIGQGQHCDPYTENFGNNRNRNPNKDNPTRGLDFIG